MVKAQVLMNLSLSLIVKMFSLQLPQSNWTKKFLTTYFVQRRPFGNLSYQYTHKSIYW